MRKEEGRTMQRPALKRLTVLGLAAAVLLMAAACQPAWKSKNNKIVKENNLQVRKRSDIPGSKVVPNLQPGVVTPIGRLPITALAPRTKAWMYWGKGVLINWMTLEPGAEIPRETLPAERLMFVMQGQVDQLINGAPVTMQALGREEPDGTHGRTPRTDFVLLEKGAANGLTAGENGAEILEVYGPVRLDYLTKAGVAAAPTSVPETVFPVKPTVLPNIVYDLNDVQFTDLVPGAHSRLVSGHAAQASFLRMDPDVPFALHLHPEEQLMIVLRGTIEELILDGKAPMKKGDTLLLPGDMVHGGKTGEQGCDVLDVFWPPRPDYADKNARQTAAFHSIIPAGSRVEVLADGSKQGPGLVFGEGCKWLNGKLYFSSMFFDQKWTGSPAKSRLVQMDPDGVYRYISRGIQTNGLMPLKNGDLAVCDMFGHRVIEMTPRGQAVRTLAATYGGKQLDGPNDLVADSRGGIYFTDPQFTAETKKFQPGRAVYYINPKGAVVQVIGFNEFAMPNGILLSPDEKTLYVNNTYDRETFWNVTTDKENYVWAFDINPADGTLSKGRKFAKLLLTPEVLHRKGRSSGADGMTIDIQGNVYVATYMGIQIFNPKGEFVGMINLPTYPVNCCFGGDDMKTLFTVSYDKVYKIAAGIEGLRYPPSLPPAEK
jgi:gluconolactonase